MAAQLGDDQQDDQYIIKVFCWTNTWTILPAMVPDLMYIHSKRKQTQWSEQWWEQTCFFVCASDWYNRIKTDVMYAVTSETSFRWNPFILHASCTSSAEEAAHGGFKLCDGAIVNTKGADPALLLCALYPSLIFIPARRATATADAQSCRFHSLHRLLCFLSPWGGGRPGWRARWRKSSRRNHQTQLLITCGSGSDVVLRHLKCCASFCLNINISEAVQSIN